MDRRGFLTLTTASSFSPGLALSPTTVSAANARRHAASYGPVSLYISAPTGKTNMPVMIYVHGGGWRIGTGNPARLDQAISSFLSAHV